MRNNLLNRYTIWLLLIFISSLIGGIILTYFGHLMMGLLSLIIFGLLLPGLKFPDADTSIVWLLKVNGRITDIKITGYTLLLERPEKILSYAPVELVNKPVEFKLEKPIECSDGYVSNGEYSVTVRPASNDDPFPRWTPGWMSGGEKLRNFINSGGFESVKDNLDDALTTIVQAIATNSGGEEGMRTVDWMQKNPDIINEEIRKRLTWDGKTPPSFDLREFGLMVVSNQAVLSAPQVVVDAQNDALRETIERESDLTDSRTMDMRIEERFLHTTNGYPRRPNTKQPLMPPEEESRLKMEIERALLKETITRQGGAELIANEGGITLAEAKLKSRGKASKGGGRQGGGQ